MKFIPHGKNHVLSVYIYFASTDFLINAVFKVNVYNVQQIQRKKKSVNLRTSVLLKFTDRATIFLEIKEI